MAWRGLHSPHLQYGQVVRFCEKWNEIPWFIKRNEFYDHLKKYNRIKNSAARSESVI
jgi:hypothetical protein